MLDYRQLTRLRELRHGSTIDKLVEIVELAIRTGISIDESEIGPFELLEEPVPADFYQSGPDGTDVEL
jgi:hypothetical protein